ncbi:MAG: NHL repeat-containing protein [Actinobacteria bacterium]|nr:NHL repeat-containing protein [Actinomycetota bacterium]
MGIALMGGAVITQSARAAVPPLIWQQGQNCGDVEAITLGECGGAAGETVMPRGVAVDPTTGDIFVADLFNARIDELSPWGTFIKAWGWGVRTGAPELQTCTTVSGCRSGLRGTGAGQMTTPVGVAVDEDGNVWVTDMDSRRIEKFDPGEAGESASLLLSFGSPGSENGQFGGWEVGNFIAAGPGPTIYVGDTNRIQEFDASGSFIKSVPVAGESVQSLAVDREGNLYVTHVTRTPYPSDRSEPNVFKLTPAGEPICTMEVANPRAVTVAGQTVYVLNQGGGLVNPHSEVLSFSASCQRINAGGSEPGFGVQQLTASTGLAATSACGISGTEVLASNATQVDSFIAAYGPPPDPTVCPPPSVPPTITSQYASAAAVESATVKAVINPHFWPDTKYFVEYGRGECSQGGCDQQQPLSPGSSLTSETVDAGLVTAGITLSGLEPDAIYRFRFVAKSGGGGPVYGVDPDGSGPEEPTAEAGAEGVFRTYESSGGPRTNCPNQVFRVGPSAWLPNCRAFEMVSPVEKNSSDVSARTAGVDLAAANGERATFTAFRGFAEPAGAPYLSQYLAERVPSVGWQTRSISAPREQLSFYPNGSEAPYLFKLFSGDLCRAWMVHDNNVALSSGMPENVPNLFRRENCGGTTYNLLTVVPPPGFGLAPFASEYFPEPQGYSADFSSTVVRADAALTPNACQVPSHGLYQVYEITGESVSLVSVLPGGQPACTHSSVGTAQGGQGAANEDNVRNAVSANGQRIFWSTTEDAKFPPNGGQGDQPGKLFLRVNAAEEQSPVAGGVCTDPQLACTYRVSQLVSPRPARFWAANRDGSRAIFSLDPNGEGQVLYEFEATGEDGAVSTQATPIAKGVLGVLGASDDATRIYFGSTAVLPVPGPNSQGSDPIAGAPNLYFYEAGEGFRFIGTLSSRDVAALGAGRQELSPIAKVPRMRTSQITPTGLQAAFASTAELTGFDNRDLNSGQPDAEVFLYDAEGAGGSGELVCVSCNTAMTRPIGKEVVTGRNFDPSLGLWAAGMLPGWTEELRAPRALSDSGRRIFFESFDRLVPRDTNGVEDVYEWERVTSRAQCIESGGERYVEEGSGCISLVSSGQSPEPAEFIDASSNGSDVFIRTNASLVSQDPGLYDLYDVREGGGFAPPPASATPCEGSVCQVPNQPPADSSPGSMTFQGKGNVKSGAQHSCPRGKQKVKAHGKTKCVKKKSKGKKKNGSKKRQSGKSGRASR